MRNAWTQERQVRLLLDAALARRLLGQTREAEALLDEALELSQTDEPSALVAAVKASQGVVARSQGAYETAAASLQEALDLRKSLNDNYGVARAMGDLARVHLDAGRVDEANWVISEAIETVQPLDSGRTRAEVLEHAGMIDVRMGDLGRAQDHLRSAVDLYRRLGDEVSLERVEAELEKIAGAGAGTLDDELSGIEKRRLLDALESEAWNQSRAARRLGLTETRVRNLMRRHGLKPRNRRGRPRKGSENNSD